MESVVSEAISDELLIARPASEHLLKDVALVFARRLGLLVVSTLIDPLFVELGGKVPLETILVVELLDISAKGKGLLFFGLHICFLFCRLLFG